MTGLEIAKVRPVIESEIDRLIALLDLLEPDPDFEDGADLEEDNADLEPMLGAPERQAGSWLGIESNYEDDCEIDTDDDEPSLAASNSFNQVHWSRGRTDDTEEQCDDEGTIDCDLEPDHDNERWSDGFPNPGTYCGPVMTTMARSD